MRLLAFLLLIAAGCHQPESAAPIRPTSQVPADSMSWLAWNGDPYAFSRARLRSALERAGWPDTLSIDSDTLRIRAGRLLDTNRRYAYILSLRFPGVAGVHAAWFAYEPDTHSLDSLATEGQTGFQGDTLRDVNGDGFRDWIYRVYPLAGCCLRDGHHVHLFNPATDRFAAPFLLINPTYGPEEGVVRGVTYSHLGEGPLYKVHFMGLAEPEQIECVYHNDEPGVYLRGPCEGRGEAGEVVRGLPAEYAGIESIEWFLGEDHWPPSR